MDITIPSSPEKLSENTISDKNDVFDKELNNPEDLFLNIKKGNETIVLRSESKEECILEETKEIACMASRTFFDSVKENTGLGCVVIDVTDQSHLHIENWLNDDQCSGSDDLKSDSYEEVDQDVEQSKVEIKEMETESGGFVESNADISHIVNDVLEEILIGVENLLISVEQEDELPNSEDARQFLNNSLNEVQTTSQPFFDALEEPTDLDSEDSVVENSPVNLTAVNPLPDEISLEYSEPEDASNSRESLSLDALDSDEEEDTVAQPSEEIGDRDDLDDLDDMDFVERMRIDDGNELITHRPHSSDILQSSDPELQDRVDSLSDSEEDVFLDVENGGEYELVEDIDFMQRMMFFFREADAAIRSRHGSGDHTWTEPEEEEAE